jgi:hypothetical protein
MGYFVAPQDPPTVVHQHRPVHFELLVESEEEFEVGGTEGDEGGGVEERLTDRFRGLDLSDDFGGVEVFVETEVL